MKDPYRLILMTLGLSVAASPATAQHLTGRVVHDASGQALQGVHVMLVDQEDNTSGQTFSDTAGSFAFVVPQAGDWRIRAERIGYASVESDPMPVSEDERVRVEVRMALEAVPLDPVIVTGRSSIMQSAIARFYQRVDRGRQSGFGRFVTREELERRNVWRATDLLRTMAGLRVVSRSSGPQSANTVVMSRGCVPAIFVDGSQINRFSGVGTSLDEFVNASAIEGIEVYRGAGHQVEGYRDDRGCGLILVWTRRGGDGARPFSLGRLIAAGSLLLGLLLLR